MDSDSKTGNFFDSVVSFFSGGNRIPWCERDVIDGYEREVKEINDGVSEENQKESTMRLAWALLVHSRQAEDIQRGIIMLDVSLESRWSSYVDVPEKLYLLAVRYYRTGDYLKSKSLVENYIQIQPDWRQALVLKTTIAVKFLMDNIIRVIITGSALGLVGAGTAAGLARKKLACSSTDFMVPYHDTFIQVFFFFHFSALYWILICFHIL